MIIIAREFLKVKCEKCNNEQKIFSRASTVVKCLVCGEVLAKPVGGKAVLQPTAKLLGELKVDK
ncbi:30S ribosomal protein S27e [uncultured archaeon]|nr:30S ribosomal protein S27e [uncultured archaeon]